MAAGDNYFTCENKNESLEQALRDLIYRDANGNPVIQTDPDGTVLEKWFTCENKNMSLEQALKLAILEDADGNPYLNTTS